MSRAALSLREQRSPINTEGISVSPVKAPSIINDITRSWKKSDTLCRLCFCYYLKIPRRIMKRKHFLWFRLLEVPALVSTTVETSGRGTAGQRAGADDRAKLTSWPGRKKRKEGEAGVPQSHLRTHTNDPQILYEPPAPAKGSSVSQEHAGGFVFNTGTKQNHIP